MSRVAKPRIHSEMSSFTARAQMNALRSLFDWAEAHRAELLDLLRIYLGVGLVVRGALFVSNPSTFDALVGRYASSPDQAELDASDPGRRLLVDAQADAIEAIEIDPSARAVAEKRLGRPVSSARLPKLAGIATHFGQLSVPPHASAAVLARSIALGDVSDRDDRDYARAEVRFQWALKPVLFLDAGYNWHLTKPINPEQLVASVFTADPQLDIRPALASLGDRDARSRRWPSRAPCSSRDTGSAAPFRSWAATTSPRR